MARALFVYSAVTFFVLVVLLRPKRWIIGLRNETSPSPETGASGLFDKDSANTSLSDATDVELRWGRQPVPLTKIMAHAPGWTVFDHLYVREGVTYVVTDLPELVPNRTEITSKGHRIQDGNANMRQMEPTDDDFKIISTAEARELFGTSAIRINGVSFLANESPQYLNHMYHFVAEMLFGMWRTYSSLDQGLEVNGHTMLPAPRRFMFPHLKMNQWRDYAAMNQYVLRAAFPSMVLEFSDTWEERASMKRQTFCFERLVLGDRVAAMHSKDYGLVERIAAQAFKLRASPNWWSTIRMAVLELSKVRKSDILNHTPVITYVSRQKWGRRMLKDEDHLRLVAGLESLRKRRGVEVHVVELDRLPRNEQILLAARTTILIGLHGNGLSTLLWMRPSLRAAVVEFFIPGGFAYDYAWTAQALDLGYYGVWGSHIFSSPNLPPRAYPEGFQGNEIPLDAEAVIQLIERRLDRPEHEFDE